MPLVRVKEGIKQERGGGVHTEESSLSPAATLPEVILAHGSHVSICPPCAGIYPTPNVPRTLPRHLTILGIFSLLDVCMIRWYGVL